MPVPNRCGLLVAALVLAATSWVAGDTVYLKDGGKIEGIVTEQGGKVRVKHRLGAVTVARSEVLRIERKKTVGQEYAKRVAQLGPDDGEGHYRLGLWLAERKRKSEAQRLFEKAVAIQPNHRAAHEALGHVFHNGVWHTHDDAMRLQGRVRYKGQWVTREVAAQMQAREAAEKAKRELKSKLNCSVANMLSPDPQTRKEGHDALLAMAEKYNCPQLRSLAAQLKGLRGARGGRPVHMEINVSQGGLVGMKPFVFQQRVNGRTITHTIQQPLMRGIRIQTNVTAPGG